MEGLTAVAASNEVRLSWSVVEREATEDELGIAAPTSFIVLVEQGDAPVRSVTVEAPATDTTVTGLRNGVEASFEVFSVTSDGSSEPAGPVVAT